MTFYAEMAQVADEILREFGAAGTLTYKTRSGEYDPDLGDYPEVDVTQPCVAAVFPVDQKLVDGTAVLSTDEQAYLPTLNKLFRQYQDGNITLKEYQALVGKLAADNYKPEKKAEGVKEEQSAYASLVATIKAKIAENNAEINSSFKLSESDKLRIKLMEELNSGAKTLTASHKARALALLDVLSAQEKEEARIKSLVAAYKQEQETAEEIAAAYVAQSKAREDGRAAVSAYANGIDEATRALQLELSLMGQSEQTRAIALEQYRIELDLKKQIAAIDANTGFNEREREEERARARAAAAIATANASSRAFLDEWKTSVGKYDDIFRQGFADMLNNGKDGWKSFTKSLATTFKTTVADQLYKAFAQPFVVNIVGNLLGLTGSLGASAVGGAAAAASGGSALGTVGNLASGAGMLGRLGSGFANGLSAWGSGGSVTGVLSNPGLYTGAELAGALAPIALGIGALVAIAKATKGETRTGGQFGVAFDGSVTNQRRGQTYTIEGQQFDRDFTNGLQTALKDGIAYRLEGDPVAQESAIRDAVSGTASGINGFLKALGSAATLTWFSAGLETSGKGRGGVFAGGLLSTGAAFGESGKGDNYAGTLYEKFSTNSPDFKTALENFTLDLKQSTIQALQTVSDIPQAVQKMLQGVDAEALTEDAANKLLETINAQIVGVETLRASFENIGLDKLAELSFDAASGLAAAAGGFDALQGKLATYYDAFYSEEEKRANTIRQITKTLRDAGAQVTADDVGKATREQFRAIYESIVDAGGAADPVAVALLNVAGAFASVTPAAEDAARAAKEVADAQAKAAEQAAQEAARRAEEVARERYGIETQLLQLLGNTTALRERELEALDASNRALQEYIYTVEDARAAYQKSIEGAQGAYSLLDRSVAAERKAADVAFNAQKAALQKESSAKLDALQSQVQSAKEAADRIRGIASSLAGALKSVRVESPQLDFARLTGARSKVSGAAASGNIFAAGLESALGVLGEDNRRFYGRFEDFAFAQGVTAGEVAKLNDSAKAQLSAADAIAMGVQAQIDVEKMLADTQLAAMQAGYDAQVSRLDDALELGKSQLDALLGIDNSVVSVQEALDRLTGAVNASNAALQAQKAAEAAAAMAVAGGSSPGAGSLQESLWAAQEAALTARLSDPEYLKGLGFNEAQIKEAKAGAESWPSALNMANRLSETLGAIKGVSGTQLIEDAYRAFRESGSPLFDLSGVGFSGSSGSGYNDPEKMRELEKLLGIDGSHAAGLAYVPFDGYRAELHRGERVLTSDEARAYTPSVYPMSMMQNGASNAAIAEALRAMAARLDAIEANTRATAGHTAGTDRKLARVVKKDALVTEVQPA